MRNTPLGWAAGNGHEGVVELLLGRDDVDPNKVNEDGSTPLLLAVDHTRGSVEATTRAGRHRPQQAGWGRPNTVNAGCLQWARGGGEHVTLPGRH